MSRASPRPWLHIAEVVAAEAAGRGFRRLGLLGTRWLAESDVYPDKLTARGLEWVRPDAAEREEINRIIFAELVYGVITPEAVACHQRVIGRMKDAGCDAVVLGCTEIPLLMNDTNSPLPTLDSTRLLARAALRRAVVPGGNPPAPAGTRTAGQAGPGAPEERAPGSERWDLRRAPEERAPWSERRDLGRAPKDRLGVTSSPTCARPSSSHLR